MRIEREKGGSIRLRIGGMCDYIRKIRDIRTKNIDSVFINEQLTTNIDNDPPLSLFRPIPSESPLE